MSYEDPNSGYTGADNSSSDVDYTQYCPYSSDENLSTRFFNSNVSVSSEQTDATEAPTEREDHYVWNNRFQEALKNVRRLEVETVQHKMRVKIWRKMFSTAADFIHSATTYGKIIISEAYLPADEKTIRPLSGRGIAGGEKYIVNSIMFKFAIDSSNLFEGDDHKASRVAGHDLLGYNCFVASGVEELNTPLVCLLDYRGFRLVAMSLLPIGRDTLVYGSDDAGVRIKTDEAVHETLLKASNWMNTAEHEVVELRTLHKRRLATALDVEVHRSNLDQRLYVVDCSRVMPASAICRDPLYRGHCNHLTMLLRPELVRSFPRPLCNDAYSSFLFPKLILKRAAAERESRRNAHGEGDNGHKTIKERIGADGLPHAIGEGDNDEDLDEYITRYLDQVNVDDHKKRAYSGAIDMDIGYLRRSDGFQIGYDSLARYAEYSATPSDLENPTYHPSAHAASSATSTSSSASHSTHRPSANQLDEDEVDYEKMMHELEDQKHIYEEDIVAATTRLRSDIVPKFAETLEKIFSQLPPVQQCAFAYDWIVVLLHWHGINIRHLGAVRECIRTENATLRSLLLNLMVSRVLKNMSHHRLRMKMRELRYAGEVPYQQCLVTFMNLVFGTSTESLSFWNNHIKHALVYQFPDGLTAEEKIVDLKTLVLDLPIIALDDLKTSLRESAARQGSNPFLPALQRATSSSSNTSPPTVESLSRNNSLNSNSSLKPVFEHPPMLHRTSDKGSSEGSLERDATLPSLNDGTHSGVSSPNVSQIFKTPSRALRASRDENVAKVMQELPMEPVCFLFFNFCRLIGVKLKGSHMVSFASNPGLFQVAEPVNVLDLDGAPQKVKTLQVVSLAEGQVWKVRAEAASSLPKSKQFAFDLWKLALEAYKSSLLANPRDQRTLRNAAEVYHAIGLLELAGVLAHLAIETNPDDSVSLYKYATYLWSSTANPERAKRYFEASIRAPNATPGSILAYSAFEVQRNNIQDAVSLVKRCLERFPTSWDAHFKMANLLQYHLKDYPKAATYYKVALDMESDDLVLLRHYVTLLHKLEPVDTSLIASYELYIKKLEQKANIAGHRTKNFYSNLIVPSAQHLPTETEPEGPDSPTSQSSPFQS